MRLKFLQFSVWLGKVGSKNKVSKVNHLEFQKSSNIVRYAHNFFREQKEIPILSSF